MTTLALVHDAALDLTDDDPGPIPAGVLAEVDAAWERAAGLAAQGRHLHLEHDAVTGRLRAAIHGPDGEVEDLALDELLGSGERRRAHRAA
jgi:hypothetical protein